MMIYGFGVQFCIRARLDEWDRLGVRSQDDYGVVSRVRMVEGLPGGDLKEILLKKNVYWEFTLIHHSNVQGVPKDTLLNPP